ncbi:complex I 24 kDa subunit family protein [Spirochaeta cellobiosiphila]|uniref:NADH-quinone oxidoreductase subunit NuoE family protein n=1 Tax=Spirochaeta cellobiosiphila TaxID=504483 RepID=UPI00048E3A14|nr:NAD(P)H-dependent oxidoreductase subunit E [Spirochaeta cellobiosiphila]
MAVDTQDELKFSDQLVAFIEEWRNKSGNLIMILHKLQEEFGYIPRQGAIKLSQMLDVPLAKIYGVVTFYHFFKLTKPGRHKISVCMGTACYLKGGQDLLVELENILGVPVNQVTDNGEFSVEAVRCIGCCGLAPVMTVGDEVFGKVKPDELPGIIAKYKD